MCNLLNLPCRLVHYSLRAALMRLPRGNFDSIKRHHSTKNTSFCEEQDDKHLQMACGRLLNMLQNPRTPEEIFLKCPISNHDDKTIIKFMSLMQIPPGTNFDQTKEVLDWWLKLKTTEVLQDQAYDKERVKLHGPDSAATHFFIDRQASVRLKDSNEWIVGGRPILKRCVSGYFVQAERGEKDYRVEAIDCTNFHNNGIRYEGLLYLSGLEYLKELILKNQMYIDAFCLDRIAGQNGKTLEYLDLTGCELDTSCVIALDKMKALKTLIVTEPKKNSDLRTDLTLLKRNKPELKVQMVEKSRRPERLSTKSAPRPSVIHPRVCRGRTSSIAALKQPYK